MAIAVEISKRLVAINAISSTITRIIRVTVLVWMYKYLLQRISPEEFSVLALVTAVMVFAPLFSSFFTSGISRYVVEAYARSDEKRATQIVSSIFPILAGWGLLFLACGWAFAWHINSFLTVPALHLADARLMMGLLTTDFVIQMVMTPFAVGFDVRQRYLILNLIQISIELFRQGLLFTLLLGLGARVIWVAVATCGANLLSVVLVTTISLRFVPTLRIKLEAFQWATARRLFTFGLWTTLIQLAAMIYIALDIILLNKFATAVDVASFKLGSDFYNQASTLIVCGLSTVVPVLTTLYARRESENLQAAVLRCARYVLWASLLLTLPLVIFRNEFITLYVGTSYLKAAAVLGLLLLLFPFMAPGWLLAPLAVATGRNRGFAIANIAVQAAKLCVTLYLIKELKLGAFGCALSTLTVVGLGHVFIFGPMALRLAGIPMFRYTKEVAIRGYLPALAGCIGWVSMALWIRPASWISLAACCAAGALIYLGTLLLFCLDAEERSDLTRLFPGLSRRSAVFRSNRMLDRTAASPGSEP
jgi:O-antigen/teichoic acid export membrane protein